MKLYIAAHDPVRAQEAAKALGRNHCIVSTWHTKPFLPTEHHSLQERAEIADRDIREVFLSDAVVLLDSPDKVPGGKFVEADIAIGQHKSVFLIGRRENMLMWSDQVQQFDSVNELVEWL